MARTRITMLEGYEGSRSNYGCAPCAAMLLGYSGFGGLLTDLWTSFTKGIASILGEHPVALEVSSFVTEVVRLREAVIRTKGTAAGAVMAAHLELTRAALALLLRQAVKFDPGIRVSVPPGTSIQGWPAGVARNVTVEEWQRLNRVTLQRETPSSLNGFGAFGALPQLLLAALGIIALTTIYVAFFYTTSKGLDTWRASNDAQLITRKLQVLTDIARVYSGLVEKGATPESAMNHVNALAKELDYKMPPPGGGGLLDELGKGVLWIGGAAVAVIWGPKLLEGLFGDRKRR